MVVKTRSERFHLELTLTDLISCYCAGTYDESTRFCPGSFAELARHLL
jgi:hypothetical protein